MDVDRMTQLLRHAVLDALALAHRDPRRDHAPGRRLVRVRPVDGPEARKRPLEARDDGVSLADLGPPTAVDVQAQDSLNLLDDDRRFGRLAIDRPEHPSARILLEA